ncbi:MAG TPA: hypothetical protein VFN11_14335 [Ktedonobacterales bacterium]|nr:hypothetical protein [Ktedonobacterales bacterium]
MANIQDPISITGLWMRTIKANEIEVLIEVDGSWYRVMQEPYTNECVISHIMEPLGMRYAIAKGPDPLTNE